MSTPAFPPETSCQLEGWQLAWFELRPTGEGQDGLEAIRHDAVAWVEERFSSGGLAADPVVAAVRRLFREAGTDPTRYRPSSEALARRVLKKGVLPAIGPIVDLNNVLSLRLMVPCCVVDPSTLRPPFVLRRGRPGESMVSFRGPFNLENKPVLEDGSGPFGTPITDAERVRVTPETGPAWLVVYGVRGLVEAAGVRQELEALLHRAPIARPAP